MKFKNFSVWHGRLPHWRADEVTYYATFRHRRDLDAFERNTLLSALLRPDTRKWNVLIACVLPDRTELIFTVNYPAQYSTLNTQDPTPESPSHLVIQSSSHLSSNHRPVELSKILEAAKTRAGKAILKKTGERFPPFYAESYDRIIRDSAELEERWLSILSSPVDADLCEDPEAFEGLYVSDREIATPMPSGNS